MGRAGTRSRTTGRGGGRANTRRDGGRIDRERRSTASRSTGGNLPIANYDEMTVGEIQSEIEDLKPAEIRKLQTYEEKHKARQTLLRKLEQQRSRMGGGRVRQSQQGAMRGRAQERRTGSRQHAGSGPATGRGSSRGTGASKRTTNHDTIRKWAEARGGVPVSVRGTGRDDRAGVLRFDFEGYGAGREELRQISWDEFFRKFDEKNLEFLYQDKTRNGNESRFFKFVQGSGGRSQPSRRRR